VVRAMSCCKNLEGGRQFGNSEEKERPPLEVVIKPLLAYSSLFRGRCLVTGLHATLYIKQIYLEGLKYTIRRRTSNIHNK
jgi:hypothetical protein